ncbi:nucleotidyltransferase domain-containing protein [Paenibacillus sp. URB8-2]|uniref:nucleotidyltransferase domain-containing protein n=1 Tax=Paenibacillus sp. URB8-2 TaxID=2741301 RepID=UPI0015BD66CA|nr:nucleotidyltransferase family protein [Paenibacillus sp. URB8-2]BCG57444.1 hypothetical protein PUR_08690 [Paenibacillus sp. URB8-2]
MDERNVIDHGILSKELLLLLALLAADKVDEVADRQSEMFADIDWKQFMRLAMHHRVYPFLYPKLSRMREGRIPSELVQWLKQEYCKNTVQMLHLSGEMGRLADKLADAGIPALFLKGPVLAQDLYGDISLRTSRDLDFIVPIGKLAEAEALLVRLGYVEEEEFETILGDWKWRQHHKTFHHPGNNIKAEVHWRLNPAPSREPDFDELWERRGTSNLLGRNIHYLGPEDLFLFLSAHGARHGWSRLRWLLDIKQLLLKQPDPGTLTRLLHRYGYDDVGGQALLLAADLLKAPIDPGLSRLAERPKARRLARLAMFYVGRMVNLHNPPLPPEVERHYRYYQPAILSWGQQLLYALGFLHPYAADAKTLPLPRRLHFLYFALRPFLWTWRKAFGEEK